MHAWGTSRRRRRAVVAACVFALSVVAGSLPGEMAVEAQIGAGQTTPLGGFNFLGRLPAVLGEAREGSLILDVPHRLALVYDQLGNPDAILWHVYNLDGPLTATGEMPKLGTIRSQTSLGDELQTNPHASRTDTVLTEPVFAIDPGRSRIFVSALGGMYELPYNANVAANPAQEVVARRWVGLPHPGAVPGVPDPAGTAAGNFVNRGVGSGFDEFGAAKGIEFWEGQNEGLQSQQPRLYVVGDLRLGQGGTPLPGVWLAGWDARPSDPAAPYPQRRQLWTYASRNCTGLARNTGTGSQFMNSVFRLGEWLYTFCETATGAKGVLRVHLSTSGASFTPGEMAPDGREEFFPGVTGQEFESFADPKTQRLYLMSKNVVGGGRSMLVFDGTVAKGQGGYIGAIGLVDVKNPEAATAGFDPVTGRWYFQDQEQLWTYEGRLRRVFPPANKPFDLQGNPTGSKAIRRIYVDPAQVDAAGKLVRPAHVLVQRQSASGTTKWFDVYEDTLSLGGAGATPTENTTEDAEGPDRVGVYTGVTSAYGLQVLDLRGLSTLVPGVQEVTETQTLGNTPPEPSNLGDYIRDPFFYHAGDCGKVDRQIAVGRVTKTRMTGTLFSRASEAESLAVDPERHRRSAPDATNTREDVDDPSECVNGLWRYATGGFCEPFRDTNQDGKVDNGDGTLCGGGKWGSGSSSFTPPDNQCRRDRDTDGDGDIDQADDNDDLPCESPEAIWNRMRQEMCGPGDARCGSFCAPDAQGASNCDFPADRLGPDWWYGEAVCAGETAAAASAGPPTAPVTGLASSSCAAAGDAPSTRAGTLVQLTPQEAAAVVTVGSVETSTAINRLPGKGIEALATSIVRDVSIAGVIQLEELRVTATVWATGRSAAKGGGSGGSGIREFKGLRVNGELKCALCGQEEVLEQINQVIGPIGYVRISDPEQDVVLGTSKGTSAALQKDFQQQDADKTMNRDDSVEWPGLEIGMYRDSDLRGPGRIVFQVGGVFAQVQFGVVPKPPDFGFKDVKTVPVAAALATKAAKPVVAPPPPPPPSPPPAPQIVRLAAAVKEPPQPAALPAPEPGILQQIAEGLKRSLKMSLLLGALWALVYGPVYLARRRQLLQEVTRL